MGRRRHRSVYVRQHGSWSLRRIGPAGHPGLLESGIELQPPFSCRTATEARWPITYNDTTYLPIRAISNALHVAVNYDGTSKLIQLGEQVDGVSIANGFDDMYHTKDPSKTVFDGKDYKEVYLNNGDGNRSASFMLYPKKKYQKLYLQIAAIGKDVDSLTIEDSDTDTGLKATTVAVSDGLKTVEVDIGGVDSLYVDAEAQDGGTVFVPLTTSYYK